MPGFGKMNPIRRQDFKEFEACYGGDPLGGSRRRDQGEGGRFRKLTRAQIAERGDNLDVFFLREAGSRTDDLPSPEEILDEIEANLELAQTELGELRSILDT
jgi:type I restriction enzyme M protein